MQQKQKQKNCDIQKPVEAEVEVSSQKITTCSVIRMEIPEEYKNENCSFQWVIENKNHNMYNNILTRFDASKMNKNNQFQCTPLDFGAYIIGKVVIPRAGNYQTVKQVKYGPVLLESNIENYVVQDESSHVKVTLGKNVQLQGKIKIISPLQTNDNSRLGILVQADDFKFQVRIDQNIRLPSNNSFFKFYEKQQNSLGISIYHQHSQFSQKLKGIKNSSHFGFYLKVHFQNRYLRDAFLLQLLQQFGTKVFGFREINTEEFKINIKPSVIVSQRKHGDNQRKHHQNNKLKQFDDQFYKLLYQASEIGNQLSFDLADAQFLFSSKKVAEAKSRSSINQGQPHKNQRKDIFLYESIKKITQFDQPKQKQDAQVVQVVQLDRKKCLQKQFSNILNEKVDKQKQKQKQPIKYNYPNFMTKQTDQNYLRSTITKLTNQIKNLMKQNRKLAQENKKLKDQNMRLRFKQIKNTSNKVPPEKLLKNTSKEVLLNQRDKSKSISPLGHEKRCSMLPIKSQKFQKPVEKYNKSIDKQQRNKNNFKAGSSSGSILITNPSTPTPKIDKNLASVVSYPSFSGILSKRDLLKQPQPQIHPLAAKPRLNEQQVYKYLRATTPKNGETEANGQIQYSNMVSMPGHMSPSTKISNFQTKAPSFINGICYRR